MAAMLVFGATGFIGSHVVEQAVLAGENVTCVVRPSSDTRFLQTLPVTIVRNDFSDDSKLAGLINPADKVINCIADTRMHIDYETRRLADVLLPTRLYKLAQQQQADCFVQLSSIMAFGFDHDAAPLNEASPCHASYDYNRIAIERESALRACYQEDATRLTLVRPATTLGERDSSFLPRFLQSYRKGVFPVVSGGRWPFACMDARDVGRMLVHLANVDEDGIQLYVGKGFTTDWLALKETMDSITGDRSRLVNMPKKPMLLVAGMMEMLYPYGTNPPLTRFSIEVLSNPMCLDDSRLRASGFTPHYSLQQTLFTCLPG